MRPPRMSPLRRALLAVGAVGVLVGILMAVVIGLSDHDDNRGAAIALSLLVAWSFLGTGLFVWDRRPDNLTGPLMVGLGFSWLLAQLSGSNVAGLYIVGETLGGLPFAVLFHLLLAFPSGRLQSRLDRWVVGGGYFLTAVYPWVTALFYDPATADDCAACPANPLLVSHYGTAYEVLFRVQDVLGVIAIAILIWRFVDRLRGAEGRDRIRNAPVWWAGVASLLFVLLIVATDIGPEEGNFDDYVYLAALLVLASVPYAFWLGVLRSRLSEAEVVAEENVRLDAELRESLEELRESRARIVEAGYAERRRLERDLHDGAQQRLVALGLGLRRVRSQLDRDPAAAGELLDEAAEELASATEELRELARGIHPPVLTDRGLVPAIEALAARAPLPVSVEAEEVKPAPAAVEAAAYFVVSEALTNVARHADADTAIVHVLSADGELEVEVRDDGRGGADLAAGSGLRGLADRVAALDGSLRVDSGARRGTTVRAVIPTRADS